MSINCNNGLSTPTLVSDPCNGVTTPATCLIDNTIYLELGLESGSTQQEINQALYLAFLNLKSQLENL